ncbi:MAG: DMT family transporter [Deltaproteobacteria bacterium]|nr:DMT family transporter [Deltaproteobacteria bacterium]MBN2674587.1 DMT family transporter [Deltaproteobacteria bacterium]
MRTNPIEKRPFWFLLLGVVIISFSPILVKLSGAPSLKVGFYRNAFALLFLIPIVLRRKARWSAGKWTVILPLIAGTLFFFDLWSWHNAISLVGPGIATLLGNFQVFFVAFFALLFLKEQLRFTFIISIPLALFGVYLIVQNTGGEKSANIFGAGLALFAAACYGVFILVMRKAQSFEQKISADMNLLYMTLCACGLFALAMLSRGESFALSSPKMFFALLANGFFPHVVGWAIISRCLPLVKASVAGITLLLQSVLTFVWEVVVFRESFSFLQVAGGLLAIIAIYLGSKAQQQKDSE